MICKKIFVYGSLRQGFGSQAFDYITKYFEFTSVAKAKGIMYDLGPYPAAVPTLEEKFIIGECYEIRNPDELNWAMGQIDDYEGVNGSFDEPALYKRRLDTVYFPDGTAVQAWVYWYINTLEGLPVVESGDVLEYMKSKNIEIG